MRRVVTGHDASGKSVFVSDAVAPRGVAMEGVPRFRIDEAWCTPGTPSLPAAREDPTTKPHAFFPAAGGTGFCFVTFPPAADLTAAAEKGVDLEAATRAFYAQFPRLADSMEAETPRMHTTQTVDYGVVVAGEICLELDDGAKNVLRAGDCVIQNGTRHAWHNLSDRPCVMAFVIVGAERSR